MIIALQSALAFGYAMQWPSSSWAWLSGIIVYIGTCIGLMMVGLQVAKRDKVYYLLTVASVSFNWVLFGTVGIVASSLIGFIHYI